MEKVSTPLNIPTGRVAQRLKAFQDPSPSSTAQSKDDSCTASTSTLGVATIPQYNQAEQLSSVSQEKQPNPSSSDTQDQPDPIELPTAKATPQHDRTSSTQSKQEEEPEFRGRAARRLSDTEPEDVGEIEDVLEDVRSRLYSVQKIVRRERSGSSQARDEMLDDLGTMLDTAIATTMTPLNTPTLQARTSFIKNRGTSASPPKQSRPSIQPSRSQSVKGVNPLHVRLSSRPAIPGYTTARVAQTEVPTRTQSPEASKRAAHLKLDLLSEQKRNRQVSEPLTTLHRPTGFPLTSPVRERTLLWESMSRAAISEEEMVRGPHPVTRFHPVSPKARSPVRSKPSTPPILLALPQLLDAEKRASEEVPSESVNPTEPNPESALLSVPLKHARSTSSQWSEKLHLVSSSTTTVQQSPSVAEPALRDEHYQKPRRSVVKNKIKDLLTSTGRKISGNTIALENSSRSDASSVRVSEMKENISDVDVIHQQHLPHLQSRPDELKQLYSTDGEQPSTRASRKQSDNGELGTSSSKVISRKPTFDHKFTFPTEKRSSSPVKAVPTTPARGRARGASSPGGRPYTVDHRFALSPSRSNSRGSRGSLTFNIKARVSPGRGLGKKDDTELFVTANIESDGSDEGQ